MPLRQQQPHPDVQHNVRDGDEYFATHGGIFKGLDRVDLNGQLAAGISGSLKLHSTRSIAANHSTDSFSRLG